jgi:hypothetical protein
VARRAAGKPGDRRFTGLLPSDGPWLITAAVMLATFMEVLDITVLESTKWVVRHSRRCSLTFKFRRV